jgi:hypothetical protein
MLRGSCPAGISFWGGVHAIHSHAAVPVFHLFSNTYSISSIKLMDIFAKQLSASPEWTK